MTLKVETIATILGVYTTPRRGIHSRPQDQVVQIIPTKFAAEIKSGIPRQTFFADLYDIFTADGIPSSKHFVEVIPDNHGKPGGLRLRLVLDENQEDRCLQELTRLSFCWNLGPVPYHATEIRELYKQGIFRKGVIAGFTRDSKDRLRVKVDIPYLRNIATLPPDLYLLDEPAPEYEPKNNSEASMHLLELD